MLNNLPVRDQASHLRELALSRYKTSGMLKPYTYAIVSGKGGVGKSTFVLNLSLELGEQGQRVLLFDADSNLGSLDLLAGVTPVYRVGDVLRGERQIDDALLDVSRRVKLLPGSSGDPSFPHLSSERRRNLLYAMTSLTEQYQLLMIDAGAGIDADVVDYAVSADEVIVVTTPEPTAVLDAYALMKVALSAKPMIKLNIVVNQAHSPNEAIEVANKLQLAVHHFLSARFRYLGFVPFDGSMRKSVAQHKPLADLSPGCDAMLSLRTIAREILIDRRRVQ